jgi:hypothetical protein
MAAPSLIRRARIGASLSRLFALVDLWRAGGAQPRRVREGPCA